MARYPVQDPAETRPAPIPADWEESVITAQITHAEIYGSDGNSRLQLLVRYGSPRNSKGEIIVQADEICLLTEFSSASPGEIIGRQISTYHKHPRGRTDSGVLLEIEPILL